MTKVVLYGNLREKYGESFTVYIHSAAEAFVALGEQLPGFYKDIYEGSWCIRRGDTFLSQECLSIGMGEEDLHIMPSAVGAKSEWIPIIIGVALMVVATPAGGSILGILKGGVELTAMQSIAFGAGVAMTLGGVSQMLFAPTLSGPEGEREENGVRKNGIFSGDWNLSKEGQVIPIIYGRMRVGSQVVQNALRTEDYNIAFEITSTDEIDTYMTTNSSTLTIQGGEGVSSTVIGYQTPQTYSDYDFPKDSIDGGRHNAPVYSLVSPGFGKISSKNVAWGKELRGVFERVETRNGVDNLYLCAIFTDLNDPKAIIADGFLRELKIFVSDPDNPVIDVATRGEADLDSYLLEYVDVRTELDSLFGRYIWEQDC
jgi:predicted phage tail protein